MEEEPKARFVITPFSQIPDSEEKAEMLAGHERGLEQIRLGDTVTREQINELIEKYSDPKAAEE